MRDWAKEIEAAIAPLNLSGGRQAEVVEELSQHLNERYDELLIAGTEEEQAYRILKQDLTDGKLVAGLKATIRVASETVPVGTTVPRVLPGLVRWGSSGLATVAPSGVAIERVFARPKSRILACPRSVTNRFGGLISR